MFQVLSHRVYGRLFCAQVIALIGTGLLTVALGLLAFDIAGANAGSVLGTALAIKMVAYVTVAPIVGAFAAQLPRRAFLIAMDLVRAVIALTLPFITETWQVYLAVFVLQSASAAFTPTFQATIPDVLPEEEDYTQAPLLSRLAYDLESIVSPMLAAVLLTVINFHWLFAGTVVGFLVSAALVLSVALPVSPAKPREGGIYDKTTRGIRIYLATPRLRGLLALNMAVAMGGALVIVNTVVIVKGRLGLDDNAVALALACFGGGSMLSALTLPRILERHADRTVMLSAATILAAVLGGFALLLFARGWTFAPGASAAGWAALLVTWALLGIGYSATQTPSGRLLRRSAHADDRPAVFAAQFALSHACWLVTYPLAGWLGATLPLATLAALFGAATLLAVVGAARLWPAGSTEAVLHDHPELPHNHPHLAEHAGRHSHAIVIDDLHPSWPSRAG
ncbi:MAG TPA: MFS transporter [Bosea sp. (in: a-proteobacteria)]|jgi:predicted MFS family arabinose efflux permease|uniref:MFS transporter n=1 Tax=Bosea sp. (in: a-proteobacteria) TaxID=1871050 RepID=UPI002E156CC9|nr:MFS transporter [Bosea sp. (in: a-proteobacteria)]